MKLTKKGAKKVHSGRVVRSRRRTARKTAKGRPSRPGEYQKHLDQIADNLNKCRATSRIERNKLAGVLRKAESEATGLSDWKAALAHVERQLGRAAELGGLFLRGDPASFVATSRDAVHTKAYDRLVSNVLKQLKARFRSLDHDTAENLVMLIFAELEKPKPWRLFKRHPDLLRVPIHSPGYPLWVADPMSGKPDAETNLKLYPARAGIGYEPLKYAFLKLRHASGHLPRFADSCGYPYWRPGGKTLPVPDCPKTVSGFDEAVVDGVCIRSITEKLLTIDRKDAGV